jgi:hypothetical protein
MCYINAFKIFAFKILRVQFDLLLLFASLEKYYSVHIGVQLFTSRPWRVKIPICFARNHFTRK